eukprot:TRINITY_DN12746_c0_g1_i7.p1 TRINITY_DN12746_c0_g1~~TRINITY_DN12746_c0_g1_i7.p1  ORF type:complete len:286 (+),score=67.91 TRINITY_DN12746_c0_g1_i7:32-889(+)
MNMLIELKTLRYLVFVLCAILLWILWSRNAQLSQPDLAEVLTGNCAQDCMESPQLVEHIQTVLAKPSGRKPVLKNPEELENQKGQSGQVEAIMEHFNHKKNGFFIEAGAWDGEQLSNTLYLETKLGWTGLLVEPNKGAFTVLQGKQRNTHSINSCLSTNRYAEQVEFKSDDVFGRIVDNSLPENSKVRKGGWNKEIGRGTSITQCYPLYSILLALGQTRIDFFSLDIEGAEMGVLRTIPWHKVDIEVFLIETNKANITEMGSFMAQAGYEMREMPPFDHLFVKKY